MLYFPFPFDKYKIIILNTHFQTLHTFHPLVDNHCFVEKLGEFEMEKYRAELNSFVIRQVVTEMGEDEETCKIKTGEWEPKNYIKCDKAAEQQFIRASRGKNSYPLKKELR